MEGNKGARGGIPLHPAVAVSAAVIRGSQVLLVQRGHAPYKGWWSLPGGVIAYGETARAAAAREVREETGLMVLVERLLGVREIVTRRHHYVLLVFRARPRFPDARPRAASDAAATRWVSRAELPALRLTPGLAGILGQLPELGRGRAN